MTAEFGKFYRVCSTGELAYCFRDGVVITIDHKIYESCRWNLCPQPHITQWPGECRGGCAGKCMGL